MNTCTTPGCGRERPEHLFVCQGDGQYDGGCEARLQAVLDELPGLYRHVEETFSRQDAIGGDGGRKSAETSLPHKPNAGDALATISEVVAGWALVFAEAVGQATVVELPAITGSVKLTLPPQNPGGWLRRNVYSIVGQPRAGEALAALEALQALAMRVIDRPGERLYAGPCPTVGCVSYDGTRAALWAQPGDAAVKCWTCRTVFMVQARREWMVNAAAGRWVTQAVALAWVRILMDAEVPYRTWQSWRARGRLHVAGEDGEGKALFRFGDVRDLAVLWMARGKRAA
jgi:hypothetical protein